tara:strand:- start:461 stop:847 length:387 start_codon:yes stop_codon:yes gene_type:complete
MKRAPKRMTIEMIMKQYSSMSKASLVRKIMKALKKLPKAKLAKLCYELEKRRLPTISTTKKNMPRLTARRAFTKTRRRRKSSYQPKGYLGLNRSKTKLVARRFNRPKRMIKGSPEAKRYMAKIRRMRK